MDKLARRLGAAVVILTIAALAPAGVLAAAPVNDTYKNAIVITSLPYTQAIDLTEATDDPGVPPCEAGAHRRIWYTYTATANQTIRASVGGDANAELALWRVINGGPKGIQLESCGVFGSDMAGNVAAGTKYAISVGQTSPEPPLVASLKIAVLPRPTNDDFSNATLISSSPFHDAFDEIATASATIESGEPSATCLLDGQLHNSLWYRIDAPIGSRVTTNVFTLGAYAIWRGNSLSNLAEVVCRNQGEGAVFDIETSAPYFIQILASPGRETIVDVSFTVAPDNDAFADATPITAVPFGVSLDLTSATVEAGEPTPTCVGDRVQTAWWSFTPTEDGLVSASGNDFLAVYTGSTLAGLTQVACGTFGQTVEVPITAGQTISVQLGFLWPSDAPASLSLTFAASPSNDSFAQATPISVGSSIPADLTAATAEPDESSPSCGSTPGRSVWFDMTGDGSSISLSLAPGSYGFAIAAYSGSTLSSLTELACRHSDGAPLTIRPADGQVVHVQLWSWDDCCTRTTTLHLDAAPAPTAQFGQSIGDPSIFDDITFYDASSDPGGNAITSWSWDFGDGATSTDQYPAHRFAADGDFSVTLTVGTSDGRTASTTQAVAVRTHDVGIVRFMVPTTARMGQTKQISVGIGNRRYPETVTVQLLVSRAGGTWQEVGVVTRAVPVLSANQTVDFAFDYTFTKADATAGKVAFRAVATPAGVRDALPTDNEAISLATKVTR